MHAAHHIPVTGRLSTTATAHRYIALTGTPYRRGLLRQRLRCIRSGAPKWTEVGAYEKNVNQCNSGRRVAGSHR